MNLLKKKAISFLITLVILFISTLIYTILLFNEKINSDYSSIYKVTLIIGIICFFTFGLITGLIEQNKGFLSSILTSIILLSIVIIIKLISKQEFTTPILIKYLMYVLASGVGGIVGVNINTKKKKKR